MSGFCGWIGDVTDEAQARHTLARMAKGLRNATAPSMHKNTGANCGLLIGGALQEVHFCAADDIWVAIVGYPDWATAADRDSARIRGHAEVAADAYRASGDTFLKRLRGHFSLAVIDVARERAVLATDRMNTWPLFYANLKSGTLVFGTSSDSVRLFDENSVDLNSQAIYDYFFFWWVPGPETIFRNQFKLLPAERLTYDRGKTTTEVYWRLPFRERHERELPELVSELKDVLTRAVTRSTAGEDPLRLGAFLSGGLDSSTIVGLACEVLGKPTKTFTVSSASPDHDESAYADIVARHFRTEHYTHELTSADILEAIEAISAGYDEPFCNSSVFGVYACAKLAKQHGIDVLLAGDGGDELFAGNKRYVDQLRLETLFQYYRRIPGFLRHALIEPAVRRFPMGRSLPFVRKARNFLELYGCPLPDRMIRGNYLENLALDRVFDGDLAAEIDKANPLRLVREPYDQTESDSLLLRMLNMDLKIVIADGDLPKVSGVCHLLGLRVRYPMLDDEVADFAAGVPPDLLVKDLKLRFFYKQAFKDFLPPEVIAKKKQGFSVPTVQVFKGNPRLNELAMDSVAAFRKRGILRSGFIDEVCRIYNAAEHDSQPANMVCDIMLLEQWLRCHG
jgi:asparagine synthase (glutamine-hydrolysing)